VLHVFCTQLCISIKIGGSKNGRNTSIYLLGRIKDMASYGITNVRLELVSLDLSVSIYVKHLKEK